MIGYVTLGTNDREKSSKFYDALCGELGVGRMMENEQFIAWGKPGGGAGIGLTKPFDGNAATRRQRRDGRASRRRTRRRSSGSTTSRLPTAGPTKALPATAAAASTPAISAIPTATSSTPS